MFKKLWVATMLVIAGAASADVVRADAVYLKVETFEVFYGAIDTTNCLVGDTLCYRFYFEFGLDESEEDLPFSNAWLYEVTGLDVGNPVETLIAQGSYSYDALNFLIKTDKKLAQFNDVIYMQGGPCDQFAETCSGDEDGYGVQAVLSPSSSKGGSLSARTTNLAGCTIKSTGSYALRQGKVGSLSLDGDGFVPFNSKSAVVIERDKVKVTTKGVCAAAPGSVATSVSALVQDRLSAHSTTRLALARFG